MERAKAMSLCVFVLGVLGGGIAFEAKTYGEYVCTGPVGPGITTCPDLIITSTNPITGDYLVLYTDKIGNREVNAETDCGTAINCTTVYLQDRP